jgi:excisionase family DNA binding protein
MESIQITNMSVVDFQRMLKQTIQEAKQEWEQQLNVPSEWEELTLEKAASELNCSVRTIRRRMKDLKITGFRVGREVTIQRKDLKKIRMASGKREN